jgi:hypothetical protein
MTTRRDLLTTAPAAGALLALGPAALTAPTFARAEETAAPGPLWRSPSLVEETVTGPNGAITSRDISEVNNRLAMTEKRAIEVAPDIWVLAGWGIAHSMAVRAPEGWIIVDTGDSTRAAKEMREKLEAAVGGRVRVAAILLTHWHYADGTAAWSDTVASSGATNGWTATARLAPAWARWPASIRRAQSRSSPCSIRPRAPMRSPTISASCPKS